MSKRTTQADVDRPRNHLWREYVPKIRLGLGVAFAAAACALDGGAQFASTAFSLVCFGSAAQRIREDLPYILPAVNAYREARNALRETNPK